MALISRKQISGDLSNARALSGSLVVSGSEIITGSLSVTGSITLNGSPIGSGGGSTDTGSLLTTASNSGSTSVITFTKGDGSTFDLTIVSASYAVSASHEIVNEVSSSHSVNADTASYVVTSLTAAPFKVIDPVISNEPVTTSDPLTTKEPVSTLALDKSPDICFLEIIAILRF